MSKVNSAMKISVSILILLICGTKLSAQALDSLNLIRKLDSLENVMITSADTAKARVWVEKGRVYLDAKEYKKSEEILNQALGYCLKVGSKRWQAEANYLLGKSLAKQGKNEEALKSFESALILFKELNNSAKLANTYIGIGSIYSYQSQYEKAMKKYQIALDIFKKLGDKKGEATTINGIGNIYTYQSQYPKALEMYQKSLALYQELGNKAGMGLSYNNMGLIFTYQDLYSNAIEMYKESIKLLEEIEDKWGMANTYLAVGTIYYEQGDDTKSIEKIQEALSIYKDLGDKERMSVCYGNFGILYEARGQFEKAMEMHHNSLEVFIELGDKRGMARSYNSIGNILIQKNNLAKAKEYIAMALDINTKWNDPYNQTHSLSHLSRLSFMQGQLKTAKKYALNALKISKEINVLDLIKYTALQNYTIDSAMGNWKEAAYHSELARRITDSLHAQEIERTTTSFELAEKDNEIQALSKEREMLNEKNSILAEKEEQQRLANNYLIGGSGIIFLFFVSVLVAFVQKQKDNKKIKLLNDTLNANNYEIKQQNEEIQVINEELSYKNSEINSSLSYAARIQDSIMAKIERLRKYLPNAFIYLRPKSIVSGDFAWMGKIPGKNQIILAAVDCTGHGVPGGFMSVMADGLLRYIVFEKGITEPSTILNELNQGIAISLDRVHPNKVREGMDMAMVHIDFNSNTMKYSGAMNPLIEIDSNSGEVITYKGDRKSVGKTFIYGMERNYHQQEIKLKEGNYYYMFSDGLQDQFSQAGRKLKSSGLRSWLLELSQKGNILEGDEFIDKKLMDWKGNGEFVDDCLVLGFRWQAG